MKEKTIYLAIEEIDNGFKGEKIVKEYRYLKSATNWMHKNPKNRHIVNKKYVKVIKNQYGCFYIA